MSQLAELSTGVVATMRSCKDAAGSVSELQRDIHRTAAALEDVVQRLGGGARFREALELIDLAGHSLGSAGESASAAIGPAEHWLSMHSANSANSAASDSPAVADMGGAPGTFETSARADPSALVDSTRSDSAASNPRALNVFIGQELEAMVAIRVARYQLQKLEQGEDRVVRAAAAKSRQRIQAERSQITSLQDVQARCEPQVLAALDLEKATDESWELRKVQHPLWPDGAPPTSRDVRQGGLGDCWLIALMGAVADRDPGNLQQMITRLDDGRFRVRFNDSGPDNSVIVDDLVPCWRGADDPLAATGVDCGWPMILEKAVAARRGFSDSSGPTYDRISGGGPTAYEEVGRWLMGTDVSVNTTPVKRELRTAVDHSCEHPTVIGMLFHTREEWKDEPTAGGSYHCGPRHAYIADGWEGSGGQGDRVILRNPHDFAAEPVSVTLVELLDRKPRIISPRMPS